MYNIVSSCYSILKEYAQTKWHLHHPVMKSPLSVQARNPFLLSGMAIAYAGTWTPWPVKMGPIGCPKTSINYQHTLLNIPDKRGPQMHHEGSLKYRKTMGPSQYNELPIMKQQANKIFIHCHLQGTMNDVQSKYNRKS